jgi:hypothetical protein
MSEEIHSGHCLCGAIHYEIAGSVLQTSLCHCEDCQRASGAPYVAWTFFKNGSLRWTKGSPKLLHFADRERSFCGDCGSPLLFYDPAFPNFYEANTCSLANPANYPPSDQCWTADEIPWAADIAALPRFHHTSPPPMLG